MWHLLFSIFRADVTCAIPSPGSPDEPEISSQGSNVGDWTELQLPSNSKVYEVQFQ